MATITLAMAACGTCLASVHGETSHAEGSHGETEAEAESDDAAGAKTRGFELGEFRIRAYYPVQAQKSMVRFVLFATVSGERYSNSKRLMQNRRHKIRDQVITATRMVPLVEFDQPDLASFRRRILLRLRRTLPELEIDDVYVSNFELKVQNL
ncbi:MAG TPA: hypothetical protein VHK01_07455 [Lacipirellulaceae bacterium]|nr:hypothetical protein [Lacipirellulaceae bacterium]